METKEKKKYDKPKVTKIKLDARTAVLGICKTSGAGGPDAYGCNDLGIDCTTIGS